MTDPTIAALSADQPASDTAKKPRRPQRTTEPAQPAAPAVAEPAAPTQEETVVEDEQEPTETSVEDALADPTAISKVTPEAAIALLIDALDIDIDPEKVKGIDIRSNGFVRIAGTDNSLRSRRVKWDDVLDFGVDE